MRPKHHSGDPSTLIDKQTGQPRLPILKSMGDAGIALLGRLPDTMRDFDALGARLAKANKRGKPYNGMYIRAVLKMDNPMTAPLRKAVDNLMAEIDAKPPHIKYRKIKVLVENGLEIPDGTVILKDAVTCICGTSFIPTTWNQINHTRACANMRTRLGTK